MTILQDGPEIEGVYANGDGTIEGFAEGKLLTGTWNRGGGSGAITFFIINNRQFSGNYNGSFEWCGGRGSAATPDDCLYTAGDFPTILVNPLIPNIVVTLAPILPPTPTP